MACRSSIVAAAFLLAGTLSVAFAASNVEKIRNEKVIVLEEVLAPGERQYRQSARESGNSPWGAPK